MSSGGGGDGGAGQRAADLESRKQAARDKLNVLFGEAPQGVTFQKVADKKGGYEFDPIIPSPIVQSIEHNVIDKITPFGSLFGGGDYYQRLARDQAIAAESDRVQAAKVLAEQAKEAAANKTARENIYSGIRDNAFTSGKRRIDDQNDVASRKLKFSLFASGLNGGSTDIDQNALLKRTYNNGLLDLGAKADSAAADVRGSDESTRLGLLQAIDSGTDQSSAISSAINQMKVNSDRAAAEAQGTTVGDLFGSVPLLYQNSQRAQGVADARDLYRYGAGGKSTPKASNGQITPTF